MRSLASLAGILALLAHLACATLCAAPVPAAPPCHQQHHQQPDAKSCADTTWNGEAAQLLGPPPLTEFALAPVSAPLRVATAVHLRPLSASPPAVLRI